MTDRELLELAAKAAGIRYIWSDFSGHVRMALKDTYDEGYYEYWEPLDDDGDALRLAVKLHFWVQINEASVEVEMWQTDDGETKTVTEYYDPPQDPYAATRRAIVRAAAAIGKEMT